MSVLLNENVTVDGTKPLIFLDFDGVINPLNRFPKWVGEGEPTELDHIFIDPKKWVPDEIPVPETEFYAPNRAEVVEFHGREYHIQWSDELVAELNDIITDGNVQIIWLTTWREYTDALLNELLGLHVPQGSWMDFPRRGGGFSGKVESIGDLYQRLDPKPPFVWLDDQETHAFANYWEGEISEANAYLSNQLATTGLVIEVQGTYGISRDEIAAVRKFLNK